MAKREPMWVMGILLLIASSGWAAEYDYFQIVQQWQPSTCTASSCKHNPSNRFSIHGVWPSLNSGAFVVDCPGSTFDIKKIVTIQAGLEKNWPNVITGNNEWLWSHEWTRHGTCSEEFLNQLQYFTFGLNVFFDYDVLSILYNNQIIPNGQQYTSAQFQEAIKASTGKTPALRCNTNSKTYKNQLHEVTLCYSKNASTLVDCPRNANTCSRPFVWDSWTVVKAASSE